MVAVTTDTEGRASQLVLIRGKMRQIEKVIAALNGVSTSVEDVLGGDGPIAEGYHLSGKPYSSMTDSENDIRTAAQTAFNSQRTSVIADLNEKYRALQAEAQSLL